MKNNNPQENLNTIVVPEIIPQRKLVYISTRITLQPWTLAQPYKFETMCDYYHISGAIMGNNIEVCMGDFFDDTEAFSIGRAGELLIPALSETLTFRNNGGSTNKVNVTCISGYLFKYNAGTGY